MIDNELNKAIHKVFGKCYHEWKRNGEVGKVIPFQDDICTECGKTQHAYVRQEVLYNKPYLAPENLHLLMDGFEKLCREKGYTFNLVCGKTKYGVVIYGQHDEILFTNLELDRSIAIGNAVVEVNN